MNLRPDLTPLLHFGAVVRAPFIVVVVVADQPTGFAASRNSQNEDRVRRQEKRILRRRNGCVCETRR